MANDCDNPEPCGKDKVIIVPACARVDIPQNSNLKTANLKVGEDVEIVLRGKLEYFSLGSRYDSPYEKEERKGELKLELVSLKVKTTSRNTDIESLLEDETDD